MSFFAPREAQTTLPCPICQAKMLIVRSCHETAMYCPKCRKQFPLRDFIGQADENMEKFLENLYCDRV